MPESLPSHVMVATDILTEGTVGVLGAGGGVLSVGSVTVRNVESAEVSPPLSVHVTLKVRSTPTGSGEKNSAVPSTWPMCCQSPELGRARQ